MQPPGIAPLAAKQGFDTIAFMPSEATRNPNPASANHTDLDGEEFRNSHGGADARAGTGSSYLSYSNCNMFKVML